MVRGLGVVVKKSNILEGLAGGVVIGDKVLGCETDKMGAKFIL